MDYKNKRFLHLKNSVFILQTFKLNGVSKMLSEIDAQGSDLNILKSAGDYLKKVVYVTAEPDGPQYIGAQESNVYNIVNYMISQDFLPVRHPNTIDPTFLNKRFLHLKDTVFIKQIG